MGYRRLFIMRKDLNMSPGKLAAQVGHCAEAYWTQLFRIFQNHADATMIGDKLIQFPIVLDIDVLENYVNDRFVKTICEARNRNHLLKARDMALELGLVEGHSFGLIRDACLTELEPEEEDGTTITGIWFAPLPDDVAHTISKKYQLYR